jgi:hypothetical protein
MNRSELFANYDNFDIEITTVSHEEFYSNFNMDTYQNYSNGNTYIQKYAIDGYDYYVYSTAYNVGWEGDMDCDQYFCKVKTMTQVERDDLRKLLTSPGFGY